MKDIVSIRNKEKYIEKTFDLLINNDFNSIRKAIVIDWINDDFKR